MKKILTAIALIYACILVPAPPGSLNFIHQLADKKRANFGDAVNFFAITVYKRSYTFKRNLQLLQKEGITGGMQYSQKTPLTKGMICLMAARYNKLNDSLLYLIFKTERYAFRVCASHKIVTTNGSEWDPVSGEELIEIMNKTINLKDKKD